MFRSFVRSASAAAVLLLAASCTGTDLTQPEVPPSELPTTFDASPIEILITISSGGGSTDTGTPPSFSLSSVPASVVEDHGFSRTIAIDPLHPFAPSMAVDYGDGSGPSSLSVDQHQTFDPTTGDILKSYSFRLSHTYATPGVYTVHVAAQTTSGSVVRSASVTVTEDLSVHIEDLQISSPVIQGEPATISLGASGPGSGDDLYELTVDYGSLMEQRFIPPGGTRSFTHVWADAGEFEVTVTISNGASTDQVVRQVTVEPRPVTLSGFVIDDPIMEGQTVSFGFTGAGPGSDALDVTLEYGDGNTGSATAVNGAVTTLEYTWPVSGLYDLTIEVADGVTTATVVQQVRVLRAPPTLSDVQFTDPLFFDQEGEISFSVADDAEGSTLTYTLEIEGQSGSGAVPTVDGAAVVRPIHGVSKGDFPASLILDSEKNGVTVSDTVLFTLSIVDVPTCEPGTWRDGSACVPAPAGSYVSQTGATAPTPCTAGTYQDQEGQASCLLAPAGSYTPNDGATEAVACAEGTYQGLAGQLACVDAGPGQYVAVTGATQPTLCAVGTFQPGTQSVSCDPAPAGHFVAGPGATVYQACAVGTFAANEGQAACDPAPLGRFVSGTGQTSATPCAPGTFADATGRVACDQAPIGRFVAVSGAAQATPCAPGTFQAGTGATSCDPAPVGTFVPVQGASQAQPCALGTWQDRTGQAGCIDAPLDSYVDVVGASNATPCPARTGTLDVASASRDACITVGAIAKVTIDDAVTEGTLVGADDGKKAGKQLDGWVDKTTRALERLEGKQQQAGCAGVRNQVAKADGLPSPKDHVKGASRPDVEKSLRRVMEENACSK